MKFSPLSDPTSRSANLKTPALEIVAALPLIPALLLLVHTQRMRRSGRQR
jgi:hypothetical protein